MKIFSKIKKFLRRIFVDYNFINYLIEENSKTYLGKVLQISDNLENKLNEINNKIDEVNKKIQVQESYIINTEITEISKAVSQMKYANIELQNIRPSKDKKNILIIGFYGAPNLGDELMLETLLEYLENLENIQITVLLSDNPQYNIDKYKNIRFIHYPKTLYDFNILAEQYDYFIFGGGAIINDKNFEKEDSYHYDLGTILIKLSMRAIAFNKKVICLALSASNKITNKEYIGKLKYIIENAFYFSVRDVYTKKFLLDEMGEHLQDKIIEINDIVLSNKEINSIIQKEKYKSKELSIGIVWIANDNNIQKLENVLNSIEQCLINFGIEKCTVNLIPFYEYCEIDTRFYNQLDKTNFTRLTINVEKYPENMSETIKLFTKNNLIIGMRYHSVLIANILAIPCVSVCYDIHEDYYNKIKYVNKIFNQEEALGYENLNNEELIKRISSIMKKDKEPINTESQKRISITSIEQMTETIKKIFN